MPLARRLLKNVQMHGKTRKYEGMRRTYWYAAMTEYAVQRSRWMFSGSLLVVKISFGPLIPIDKFCFFRYFAFSPLRRVLNTCSFRPQVIGAIF